MKILYIPPLPSMVAGAEIPQMDLNDRSGDTWQFFFGSMEGMPLPMAENQEYKEPLFPEEGWVPVIVPGELAMQGFNIENNTEYYYRRQLVIPEDYENQRIRIRFDGVYSNARCWIDGHYIRSHVGGFTSWDCDITAYVKPGKSATLLVGVADLEGSERGSYNPDGKILGDASWASYYAHHNLGGILRDVTLYALPQTYLARLHTEVHFDAQYRNAELAVETELGGTPENESVILRIRDAESQEVASGVVEPGASGIRIPVQEPHHWDAEHPYLYTLEVELCRENLVIERVVQMIGFRELRYGGADGTDANKLYVNGREVKLRGTCRHDVSWKSGRSTTREEDWDEIRAYREANINHVRTSHYPPSRHLLEACDALGMYVEEENSACFQGANGYSIYCAPEEFVSPFKEMIERDRNHACIIIWSLGNESSFERTSGFRTEYDYVKRTDRSRPVIFSYTNTVETMPLPYDICSCHYESFDNNLGGSDIPVLHDEFAHIPCYDLEELRRDPNVRNYWGSSLKKAWERLFRTDGALGADLWGGIDDVFMLPEGVDERWQCHSTGSAAGYGQWGNVLDIYRRRKPEAYMTKKAYSPIRLDEEHAILHGHELLIPLENWFDHTYLSEVSLQIHKDGEMQNIQLPNIAPHGKGVLALQGHWEFVRVLELEFYYQDRVIDAYRMELSEEPMPEPVKTDIVPEIHEEGDILMVTAGDTELRFSRSKAMLMEGSYKGQTLFTGMQIHMEGVQLPAWRKDRGLYAAIEGRKAVVVLQGLYGSVLGMQYIFRISGDGCITVEYQMRSGSVRAESLSELGLRFDIPGDVEQVRWERQGLYSVYPEDHIGRNRGTARRVCLEAQKAGYGARPDWSWKDDMYDAFLYGPEAPDGGLATHDFKSLKEYIRKYEVQFASSVGEIVVEANGDTAARVEVRPDGASLIIDQQWWYPQLGWGNDPGHPIRYCAGGARGMAQLRLCAGSL